MSYHPIDDTGRIVTLRSEQRCEWCGERLNPGYRAVKRVYKWDGDFVSAHMHLGCFEAMKRYYMLEHVDPDDMFQVYEMIRGEPRDRWE